jgi:outer membrane receptor protein involved in Fe transport
MDNYELGIKSIWLDNRLQVNAQLFLMKWSDYQVAIWPDDLPWWVGGTVNADTAQSKGLEVSVEWRATDNLQVKTHAFFADAEFTADVLIGDDLYRDGMPMVNSPDTKAYLSLLYDVPADVLGGNLWLWYDISYTSETWGRTWYIIDQNMDGLAPSRHTSNFQIGLDLPNELSVTLQVDNVWDNDSYEYVELGGAYQPQWFGVDREQNLRSLARPRTAWISVRKGFGGR